MEESAKQRFVFFTLFTLGITCLLTSLGTYWTTLTFQTGFSKLSQFHYNMAIGLTKLQTCVLTPFHTKESCSVKTYWELRGDSQGGNDNDGGNNDGGFDNNPLGKLQDRCEDQLIATDLFVFISISTLVIGFGIYLLQDNFEKLTGIGNLPLKIGTTIAAILTTTGTILWAVGGCYLGFKDALEDAHAKISSFPFGNTMAVGDAQVHLSIGWFFSFISALFLVFASVFILKKSPNFSRNSNSTIPKGYTSLRNEAGHALTNDSL